MTILKMITHEIKAVDQAIHELPDTPENEEEYRELIHYRYITLERIKVQAMVNNGLFVTV